MDPPPGASCWKHAFGMTPPSPQGGGKHAHTGQNSIFSDGADHIRPGFSLTPARHARRRRRGGSGRAAPAARRCAAAVRRSARPARIPPPAGGSSACAGAGPRMASTAFCSSNRVNSSCISSNTIGRHLMARRSSPMARASTSDWSPTVGCIEPGQALRHARGVLRRGADDARLAEQLVALGHLLLVPGRARAAEGDAHALAPVRHPSRGVRRSRLGGPGFEALLDLGETVRPAVAPVLPGEEAVPAAPGGARAVVALLRADKGEIADGNDVRRRPMPRLWNACPACTAARGSPARRRSAHGPRIARRLPGCGARPAGRCRREATHRRPVPPASPPPPARPPARPGRRR